MNFNISMNEWVVALLIVAVGLCFAVRCAAESECDPVAADPPIKVKATDHGIYISPDFPPAREITTPAENL